MEDKYLVSYEFKEKYGCLVNTKTATNVFNKNELGDIARFTNSYDNYLKILFCQKL